MCHTTAHRFVCGHTHTHHISPCRLTYASPTTRNPLCSSASAACPDLTVRVSIKCHNCQYDQFVARWHQRISDLNERSDNLRMLMNDFGNTSSCSEFDEEWGPESGGWGSAGIDGMGSDAFCSSEDAHARVKKEYAESRDHVQRLRVQFEREEASEFVGFAAARLGDIRGQRWERLRRRRSERQVYSATGQKSPLKIVANVADQEDAPSPIKPLAFPFPGYLRNWDEGSAVLDSDSESGDDTRMSRAGSTDSMLSVDSQTTSIGSVFSDDDDAQPWAESRWDEAEPVPEMKDADLVCDEDEMEPKEVGHGRPELRRAYACSGLSVVTQSEEMKTSHAPIISAAISPPGWAEVKSKPILTPTELSVSPTTLTSPSSPSWWDRKSDGSWGAEEEEIDLPNYGF